jgi:acetyltransferase EpsM
VLDNKIILVGYSGHGLVVVDLARGCNLDILGYAEKSKKINNPFHLSYLGNEEDENFIGWKLKADFLIGIGDNFTREKIFNLIFSKGCSVRNLICESAKISTNVTVGQGSFINKNVSINAFARIGQNVILNTACVIEHECIIADSVHVAPGAVLAGGVVVGERSFIGANSVIKQGVSIGKEAIIGAGSVVLSNIPDGGKFVGNPAKQIA